MNPTPGKRIIGRRLFTDGSEREVCEGRDGRKYVEGEDGELIAG
jgi:hypothetical protein